MAYESILDLHSRLPNTPNVVPRKTRLALGAVPRTKSKSQLVHHICQSCLFAGHLAIFILRLPSTWFRLFVNSLCYNYRHLNTRIHTHTYSASQNVHNPQTNAIFMYRLRWVFVPWISPYKTKSGRQKVRLHDLESSLLCLRQSLWTDCLWLFYEFSSYIFICIITQFRLTHEETERFASVHVPVWAHTTSLCSNYLLRTKLTYGAC